MTKSTESMTEQEEIRATARRTITPTKGDHDSCKLCKAVIEEDETRFEFRTEYSDEPGLARFATVCNSCAAVLWEAVGRHTRKQIREIVELQRSKVGRRR